MFFKLDYYLVIDIYCKCCDDYYCCGIDQDDCQNFQVEKVQKFFVIEDCQDCWDEEKQYFGEQLFCIVVKVCDFQLFGCQQC